MEKNIRKCCQISDKIETIFNELQIDYEKVELEDEDLNYFIKFGTYGRFKALRSIRSFLYLHDSDFSMNLIIFNIYNLDENAANIDTLDIYEIVNAINSGLIGGNFLVEDNSRIIYKSSINCAENYSGLDKLLLKRQLDIFLRGLEKLFDVIRAAEENDG